MEATNWKKILILKNPFKLFLACYRNVWPGDGPPSSLQPKRAKAFTKTIREISYCDFFTFVDASRYPTAGGTVEISTVIYMNNTLKNSNKKGLTDNILRLLAGGEFDEENNFSGHYLGQTHLIFFSANSIKLKPNHAIKKNSSN